MGVIDFLRAIDGSDEELREWKRYSDKLSANNTALREENDGLRSYIATLKQQNDTLREENAALSRINSQFVKLQSEFATLESWNQQLMKRIEEAEATGKFEIVRDVKSKNGEGLERLAQILETWQVKGKVETVVTDEQDDLAVKVADFLQNTTLDEIYLNARTYNALSRRTGMKTLADVVSCPMSRLLKLRNFGKQTANDLAFRLMEDYGLEVAKEKTVEEQEKIDRILLPSRMRLMKIEAMGLSIETYTTIQMWNISHYMGMQNASDLHYCYVEGNLISTIGEEAAAEVVEKLKEFGFLT